MNNEPSFDVIVKTNEDHQTIKANVTIKLFFSGYHQEQGGFNLIEGPNGLFLNSPSKKYQDRNGETRYFKYIKNNEKLQKELEDMAIAKYMQLPDKPKTKTQKEDLSWHSQKYGSWQNKNKGELSDLLNNNEDNKNKNNDNNKENNDNDENKDLPWEYDL